MYHLALDLDNTIKGQIEEIIRQAQLKYNVSLTLEDDFDVWDKPIGHKLGMGYEEFLKWAWMNPEIQWQAQPLPGAVEGVKSLYRTHHITILTATAFPALVDPWCFRWGIPYHNIVFATDKSQADFDMLIDDSPGTLKQLSALGRNVVRFSRPWNAIEELAHLPIINRWNNRNLGRVLSDSTI